MATLTTTVQVARVGDSLEIKGIDPPSNFTLVVVHADERIEIQPATFKWPSWSDDRRSIDIAFESTNDLVHCTVPEPGPQTKAEYQALVEEVRGAVARGETTRHVLHPLKPLPDSIRVLYDREHIDGIAGFHASDEDGGMWIETVTETRPGDEPKLGLSERFLRADGYDVPPFTGTPCPKCFPEQGK